MEASLTCILSLLFVVVAVAEAGAEDESFPFTPFDSDDSDSTIADVKLEVVDDLLMQQQDAPLAPKSSGKEDVCCGCSLM